MTVTGRVGAPEATRPGGARVLPVPPPLYYGAAFAAGMVLRGATTTLAFGARPATTILDAVALAAGAALGLAGVAAVVRHRTTIVPHRAVSTLLTTGVYRISRNPMYAGLAIVYLGAALLVGSWWPIVTLPCALLAIRGLVIAAEERYLADRFGTTYAGYQARVRRWL